MPSVKPLSLYLFCAVAMCYGWGWRGSYGHERGAMVPGALVAMAVCLASARQDWHRRSVVAGLCGAIGWAWGGTLTNMEHRLYILSDTPVDVVYGFACIGLVGLLWSGVGGAILAMAFTRSRSELNRFIGPITVIGTAFLMTYLYFFFDPAQFRSYTEYTRKEWHSSEWLAALTIVVVLIPYWFLRRRDRPATRLILECAVAWWVGYLALTKIGGIQLAPPYRSESWAGVLGIQVALIWHHIRVRDRAALVFACYAMLAGCIGFVLALQIHVPFATGWGYFAPLSSWKHAEESFGFFMGFGIAMGAGRLLKGRLAPAHEDEDRAPLDLFGAFVLLVAMMWMNLKYNVVQWRSRWSVLPDEPFAYFKEPFPQIEAWVYFLLIGVLGTAVTLYGLNLYRRRRLAFVPTTSFGKGGLLFLVIIGITLAAAIAKNVPKYKDPSALLNSLSFVVLAGLAVWLLFARSEKSLCSAEPDAPGTPPFDSSWKLGWKYWAVWAWVPIHICIASAIAVTIEDGPWRKEDGRERHRFGPDATWRLEAEKQAARTRDARSAGDQPNIVWIVAEDMSCDFGYQGQKTIGTPNVDRLAREGARFTRAYVTSPVCSPSRSALITGMYQTTIGAHNHRSFRGTLRHHLPAPYRLIPEYFKDAGYYVSNGGGGSATELGKTDYNFEAPSELYDGSDWSGREEGQPFFAQIQLRGGKARSVEISNPVDPADVRLPPYYPDDPVLREDWARYLNSVKHVDDEVGGILARLEQEGLSERTVVFFTTDHGISHARGKQFLYEEGTRVPLLVWAPGRVHPDSRDELVAHIDTAATSLYFAGIPLPDHLEARPLFGPDAEPREYVVSARDRCDETVDRVRSVRRGRFSYIRNYYPNRPYLQPCAYKDHKEILIRLRELHSDGKLDRHQSLILGATRPREELYDLEKDPHELDNLAGDPAYSADLAVIRASLARWVVESGDRGTRPEPAAVYDDSMRVYFENQRRKFGAGHPRIRVFENNIALMKRWAEQGK